MVPPLTRGRRNGREYGSSEVRRTRLPGPSANEDLRYLLNLELEPLMRLEYLCWKKLWPREAWKSQAEAHGGHRLLQG